MNYDILVNKDHPLPNNYIPENLVNTHSRSIQGEKEVYGKDKDDIYLNAQAFIQFKKLQRAALEAGFDIEIDSAYRSYEYQKALLTKYLIEDGDAAYSYCAFPGTSEHQTGLAIDLCIFREKRYIDTNIDESREEIKWVMENAHQYGFILRYPLAEDGHKEAVNKITGYKYEPWHYRYIGIKLANQLYIENLTLEEYHNQKKALQNNSLSF